eukprot:5340339-Amphidinium_carterae.1
MSMPRVTIPMFSGGIRFLGGHALIIIDHCNRKVHREENSRQQATLHVCRPHTLEVAKYNADKVRSGHIKDYTLVEVNGHMNMRQVTHPLVLQECPTRTRYPAVALFKITSCNQPAAIASEQHRKGLMMKVMPMFYGAIEIYGASWFIVSRFLQHKGMFDAQAPLTQVHKLTHNNRDGIVQATFLTECYS